MLLRFALAILALGWSVGAGAQQPDYLVPGFTPTADPVSPSGVRATGDLPVAQHLRNTGGSDGAGLCVATSVVVAARWQGLPEMEGFRKFCEGRPGGSYPEQLARDLAEYARRQRITLPPYVQHTGGDPAFLDLCLRTRRMPAITHTPFHMVSAAHLDSECGAIIDNNNPGHWEWANRATFLRAWGDRGKGWAFVWLAPPPPPGEAEDSLSPVRPPIRPPIRPAPRPQPAPCPGPFCPWRKVVYWGGVVEWKLFGAEGQFLGQLQADGWHPAVGEGWSGEPQGEPPVARPELWQTGVNPERIPKGQYRYWVNGVEVSQLVAYTAVRDSAGPLVDDSHKYHLTLIAQTPRERAELLRKAPLLPGFERVHLQVYLPTYWAADRVRSPLTLQRPAKEGGQVVFEAAADPVAIAEALRRADPNWRPAPEPAPTPRPAPEPKPPAPDPVPVVPQPLVTPAGPAPPELAKPGAGSGVVAILVLILSALFRR